ncbi:MAG TPA: PilZ domain-containing protein [Terracidiphilus sp.]|nr:PilZ domain-containing protein [Terracidiphilus sp.]
METQRFCVYNLAQESFLSLEVTAVDTTAVSIRKLIQSIEAIQSGVGLWLTPYRGIPSVPGLPSFDLIYLDEDLCVVQQVEMYPHPGAANFREPVASALALPAHTIFASQTQAGDQLAICSSAEMEQRLEMLSHPAIPAPFARGGDYPVAAYEDASAPSPSEEQTRQIQHAVRELNRTRAESQGQKRESWKKRLLRWLLGDFPDRRKAKRLPLPDLVAYYWTGAVPHACHIGNISESGLYLLTKKRPLVGTMVLMTLQRTDTDGELLGDAITVQTKVIRWGVDGIGVSFVPFPAAAANTGEIRQQVWADQKALQGFLLQLNSPPQEK